MSNPPTLLGSAVSKHKVFLSYYHKDDQHYKNEFERIFGHLFISKSVGIGDIDSDVSTEYIKKLIQQDYVRDCSVLIVLLGPKTHCRKHVDWEISAALNMKVSGYSGVVGILLPTHPDYQKPNYQPDNVPARLLDNNRSGYAKIHDWPTTFESLTAIIERSFQSRVTDSDKIENGRIQLVNNRCD